MQPKLIKAHGYIAETHQIWTEDDYCLNVHRVLPPNDRVPSNIDIPHPNLDTNITFINNDKNSDSSDSLNCQQVLEALESCNTNISKLPVIVSHGLMSSSADWVLLGPHKALG